MAITKIHTIKKTLNLAINYIINDKKTDEKILVSSVGCTLETAHLKFINTRDVNKTRGNVLAHHLIQSFYPVEVTPDKAHEIGEELAKKILKGQYEYVIADYVDKVHIHNHIIFSNINFEAGKFYKSNTKTYHKILTENDKLCEKNSIMLIDEYYEAYKRNTKPVALHSMNSTKRNKESHRKADCNLILIEALRKLNTGKTFLNSWTTLAMKSNQESI